MEMKQEDAVLRSFAQCLSDFANTNEMKLFRLHNDQFILLQDMPFELSRMEKTIFSLCDTLKTKQYVHQDVPLMSKSIWASALIIFTL